MLDLPPDEHSTLRRSVISFHNDWLLAKALNPLAESVDLIPPSLKSIIKDVDTLARQLRNEEEIDPRLLPFLKQALIWDRRERAASVEERSSRAHNVEVLETLQAELTPLSQIMMKDWFKEAICCWSTILSVANWSGKMSVHGRTDIEWQGTEQVTDLERSAGAILVDAGGRPAPGSK